MGNWGGVGGGEICAYNIHLWQYNLTSYGLKAILSCKYRIQSCKHWGSIKTILFMFQARTQDFSNGGGGAFIIYLR